MQYVPEQKRTIAAHGFLNLLLRLRRVLLQDCAFLQQRHPDNLLLKHDIFQSDAYRAYAAQVVQRSKAVKAPMEVQLQQVMPTLHAKMDTISGVLETGVKDIHSVLQQHLRGLREELLPTLSGIDRVQATQMIDQQRIGASLNLLAQSLQLVTEGTFETRLRLPNEVATETSGDRPAARAGGRGQHAETGRARYSPFTVSIDSCHQPSDFVQPDFFLSEIASRDSACHPIDGNIFIGGEPYDRRHALERVDSRRIRPSVNRGDDQKGLTEVRESAQAIFQEEDRNRRGETSGVYAYRARVCHRCSHGSIYGPAPTLDDEASRLDKETGR